MRIRRLNRRRFLLACSAWLGSMLLPAFAAGELELQQAGQLRVALYADYPPYSTNGRGVEVDLAKALAARLGLDADIVEFVADEDMGDDLRNMVWRGHWRGTNHLGHRRADVMLHVPVDPHFVARQRRVAIFGPYHLERMAIARDPQRVPAPGHSAAEVFEVFHREKIGAEVDTHGSEFLLNVLGGRIRDNVVHFRTIAEATTALARGEVAAVLATHTQLEGSLHGTAGYPVEPLHMPEMRVSAWPLGMAVKVEHTALAAALADALADLQRSGELERIFAAHGLTHVVP